MIETVFIFQTSAIVVLNFILVAFKDVFKGACKEPGPTLSCEFRNSGGEQTLSRWCS